MKRVMDRRLLLISYEHRENRENRERTAMICFNCGKIGHKAADCWGIKNGDGMQKVVAPGNDSGTGGAANSDGGAEKNGGVAKIVCFTCQEEGHKSPQCPKKVENGKGAKIRSVNRVWSEKGKSTELNGRVNKFETPIILDSGSSISTVLETMVSPDQLTGENVIIDSIFNEDLIELPLAEVWFEIGDLKWKEEVAVAPVTETGLNEVIYALNLWSNRGKKLAAMVDEDGEDETEEEIKMVVPRSMAKIEKKEELEVALENAQAGPTVVACDVSRQEQEVPVTQEVLMEQEEEEEMPVVQEDEQDDLCILVEEGEMKNLCFWKDSSEDEKEDEKEEEFILKKHQGGDLNLEMLIALEGDSEKILGEETEQDVAGMGGNVFILENDGHDKVKKNRGDQASIEKKKPCVETEGGKILLGQSSIGQIPIGEKPKPTLLAHRLPEKEVDRGGVREGNSLKTGYWLEAGFCILIAILLSYYAVFSPDVVDWGDVMMDTFDEIKVSWLKICILCFPCQSDYFLSYVDISMLRMDRQKDFDLKTDFQIWISWLHQRLYGWRKKLFEFIISNWRFLQQWKLDISTTQPRAAEFLEIGGDVGITPLEKIERKGTGSSDQ